MALQHGIPAPRQAEGADLLGQDTPARARIGCRGISSTAGRAEPRARVSSAVMVPTRRAANPSHLLNCKYPENRETGFFPLQGEDHALFFKLISSSSS